MLKDRYKTLVSKFNGIEDDMYDFIQQRMQNICNYVDVVVTMEYTVPILRARYDGQDLIDKIENLDYRRRAAHELAISSVAQLNRLCVSKNIEKLFLGDENDRYQIADFCKEVVDELFEGRTK